jgi:sugar lactone lactonase YvrE
VPFRRGIGGIGLHQSGAVIVSGRNVAAKVPRSADDAEWDTAVVLEKHPDEGWTGFADMTVDPHGRILVGTLKFLPDLDDLPAEPPPGQLICIANDGSHQILNDDVLLTNGLDASPDGKRLYHVDSLRHHVLVYECDSRGNYGRAEVFAKIDRGLPDGMTVSTDGHLLIALAYHGGVLVLDDTGREVDFIDVPEPMTTAVCYGGDDWSTLYVVTGFVHSDIQTTELGGKVFAVDGAGTGTPPVRADVPLVLPTGDPAEGGG